MAFIAEKVISCFVITSRKKPPEMSVVKRTVERDLSAMQKMGVLVREGNTSAGHWVLITDKTE